jgi:hypothetical protein
MICIIASFPIVCVDFFKVYDKTRKEKHNIYISYLMLKFKFIISYFEQFLQLAIASFKEGNDRAFTP